MSIFVGQQLERDYRDTERERESVGGVCDMHDDHTTVRVHTSTHPLNSALLKFSPSMNYTVVKYVSTSVEC